jgi:hypothetical protein
MAANAHELRNKNKHFRLSLQFCYVASRPSFQRAEWAI